MKEFTPRRNPNNVHLWHTFLQIKWQDYTRNHTKKRILWQDILSIKWQDGRAWKDSYQEETLANVQCDKTFSQLSDKNKHERIHTNEKPYKCAYCDKSFSQLRYKDNPGDNHERIHTKKQPYQCAYCDKSFSHLSGRTQHEIIHTKEKSEKPYQCSYCDKTFSQPSNKTTHERIHTKEKPYVMG